MIPFQFACCEAYHKVLFVAWLLQCRKIFLKILALKQEELQTFSP